MEVFWQALREAVVLLVRGDSYVYEVMWMSIQVAGLATITGMAVGIPLGTWLGIKKFRGWGAAATVLNVGMMLPPVAVGLFVFMLLSRQGVLGSLGLLYTPAAMVVAEFFIAAPVIGAITMSGVGSVPKEVRLQALALGASRWQSLWVVLREARVTLLSGIVAGFGAAISEVGAVMMVGGNLSSGGHNLTGTMTTAIVALARQGEYARAMAFALILLVIAFVITLALTYLQRGVRRRWLQS
ncbi:MAG: ABC transporter permease [Thermoleophilia bacterium]|nr:ABC transporter permease [Thermoleophilia bacterium]